MLSSKSLNNCGQNQPLNNTLAIINYLEELLLLLKRYEDRKEDYPSIIVLKNVYKEEAQNIAQKIANKLFKGVLSDNFIDN